MHRVQILEQIKAYAGRFPGENTVVEDMACFVKRYGDCFERTLSVGHVTGSAWVVNKPGTHVLLTHHKKLNRWLQLGGHADGEHDVLEVALREAREESGIEDIAAVSTDVFDIDIHLIPERKGEAAHYHYDIRFAFRVMCSENYIVSDESHDLAWVPVNAMREYSTEQSMLRMCKKWQNWHED